MSKVNFKKLMLILLFIIFVFLIAYFLYSTFFKKKDVVIPFDQNYEQQGTLPNIDEGGVNVQSGTTPSKSTTEIIDTKKEEIAGKAISDDMLEKTAKGGLVKSNLLIPKKIELEYFNNLSNGINYYDRAKQAFFTLLPDGTIKRLSDNEFISVSNVSWSGDAKQAIMTYPDNSNVLYDFDKDRQIATLPSNMKDFVFSSTANKISAKWVDDQNRKEFNYITISDSNGANIKFLEPIGEEAKDVQNVWSPDNEVVSTYRKYKDAERQEVFFINPNDKNLKSLVVDGRGFEARWNPKGNKILYSVFSSYSDFSPTLWVANGYSNQLGYGKTSLGVNTWINKCDFSKNNDTILYCAVPDYLPTGSAWYKELTKNIPYSIYKINIINAKKEIIAQPVVGSSRVSIGKIYSNKGDDKIYYTDESSGYLYSIDLK